MGTPEPGLTVLALGAGRQSTTLALLAVEGVLPRPDAAIFADTGWEPAAVYAHLDRLEKVLAEAGIPLYRVARGNLPEDVLDPLRHATIPAFTRGPDGSFGAIARRCTGRYKVEPIERQVRLLLGARARDIPCRYCDASGVRRPPWDLDRVGPCSVCRGTGVRTLVGPVPAGAHAEQWIGFAAEEELLRRNDSRFPAYITPAYPLVDLRMTTSDCLRWLAARGWTSVAKSACVGCPFHGNAHWRAMRDTCDCSHIRTGHWRASGACGVVVATVPNPHDPAEPTAVICPCRGFHASDWAAAVEFDRAFRTGHGLDGQRFLHASRLPLDQAPIDRVTPAEWAGRQGDIFDVVELGDPDGCSPYGCRSGEPTEAASSPPPPALPRKEPSDDGRPQDREPADEGRGRRDA